jgi:ABC-type lipopolysaccharide export system ATPase subunit
MAMTGNGLGRSLRAETLVKAYKKRVVVSGLSLALDAGEVVGLLGPTARKTTFSHDPRAHVLTLGGSR